MVHFNFGEDFLTVGKALAISKGELKAQLSDLTKKKVAKSALRVSKIVDKGMPVYGINTGFGPLCTTSISKEKTKILQSNILQSHSVGVGEPIANQLAKLMLILKVQALSKRIFRHTITNLRTYYLAYRKRYYTCSSFSGLGRRIR